MENIKKPSLEKTKQWLDWKKVQKEILAQFEKTKKAEQRVELFAKLTDDYGLDTVLSSLEIIGDASSSALFGLYLMFEANQSNLRKTDFLKIIALETADFAIGSIPIVGIVGDHFFKANKISSQYFIRNMEEIKQKALELGITAEEIAQVEKTATELPQLLTRPVKFFKNDTAMQMIA